MAKAEQINTSKLRLYKTLRFSIISATNAKHENSIKVFLDLNCQYTLKIIQKILDEHSIPFQIGPCQGMDPITPPTNYFQWSEYERMDWDNDERRRSSYRIRKGLSRKAQLCHYTSNYISKYPHCGLGRYLPETRIIQTWDLFENSSRNHHMSFGERLGLCLAEAQRWMNDEEELYEERLLSNPKEDAPVWILKPSTTNKGDGIGIFHCLEQLREAVLEYEHIREWVLQRYIPRPLLLQKRKFHIRAYVMAVGALTVYFFEKVLFLRSLGKYDLNDTASVENHITNTAYQQQQSKGNLQQCVLLEEQVIQILVNNKTCSTIHKAKQRLRKVYQDMHTITRQIFQVYKNEPMGLEPLEGNFEHYGFDFLVDENWNVFLLEINPGPDFQQTGEECKCVIEGLMRDTVHVALLGNGCYGTGFCKVLEWDCVGYGGGGR